MNKKITLVLLAIIMSVSLMSCSNNNTNDISKEVKSGEKTVTTTEQTGSEDKSIVVTDMAGRQVTLPSKINKVATFGAIGVLNAFVESLGVGDKICNDMSPSFKKTDRWKYQYKFVPTLAEKPQFENGNREIIIEKVLEVKPDVCLVMNKEQLEVLEKQGLNVVFLSWNNVDDVKKCINILGEVFNTKERAEDYTKYFDEKINTAKKLVEQIPQTDRKKVIYGDIITYKQPHVIAEWWIEQAGGISVTNNGRKEDTFSYSLEDLLNWKPDIIFLSTTKTADDVIASDARLSTIPAIKNKAIYNVPTVAHVWGNRTVEQPLTIMWAMNKMYPEIMKKEELEKEIYYFYEHFYNYKLSKDEIAEIIK
ncbi:iron complex transport system substrate-binding protein [[Eubacterium] yurii]|nr:iron complex transport system substrate-binding protein [[Eubacterium] yurii]